MMMLGKRHRQPIKRTPSMMEFNFDRSSPVSATAGTQPDQNRPPFTLGGSDSEIPANVSPRVVSRRNSADFVPLNSDSDEHFSSFLSACSLCNRRLVPGRDIYMYRGDRAYCSQECRQQQVKHDERKEKAVAASAARCSVAAATATTNKQQASAVSASPASSNTDPIGAIN